jgi:hypothetical protein
MNRVIIVATLLALTGCYTTKMYYASQIPSPAVRSDTAHTFLFGTVAGAEVNLENLCGKAGISELQTGLAPEGLAATIITFGLWTPMKVTATCTGRDQPAPTE